PSPRDTKNTPTTTSHSSSSLPSEYGCDLMSLCLRVEDLFKAHVNRRLGRRELMTTAARLGVGGMAAGFLLNRFATAALAQGDFDWKKHAGKTVKLLLNQHPYTDAMIANIDNFRELTGMEVTYDVFPEDV